MNAKPFFLKFTKIELNNTVKFVLFLGLSRIWSRMRSIERCHLHFQWPWMTSNPGFKVTVVFKGEYLNGALYIVQLQIKNNSFA